MGLLTREQLLTRESLKIERVDLGNGNFVYVRQMTARERDMFERSLIQTTEQPDGSIEVKRMLEDFRAKLAVLVLCDENGNNLLRPEDYKQLGESLSAETMEKIVEVAQNLNRITPQSKEVLLKNSESDPSAGSISG